MKGENEMADEKVHYTIVKLAHNVSSWCDRKNNIYLSRPNKMSKRLKEGCDMEMINKGVEAGLLILEVRCEKQEQKYEVKEVPAEPVHIAIPEGVSVPEETIEPEVKKVRRRKKEVDEVKVEVNIVKDKEE